MRNAPVIDAKDRVNIDILCLINWSFDNIDTNNTFWRFDLTLRNTTVCTGCKAVLRNTRQLAINFYHNGSAAGLATPSSATTFNF